MITFVRGLEIHQLICALKIIGAEQLKMEKPDKLCFAGAMAEEESWNDIQYEA